MLCGDRFMTVPVDLHKSFFFANQDLFFVAQKFDEFIFHLHDMDYKMAA
jgi:hypothetical protein